MKSKRLIVSVVVYLFCWSSLISQYSLSSVVKSKESGEVLAGVEVYHHESGRTHFSDDSGVILFNDLQQGKNIFTLFALEYETFSDTLTLSSNINHTFVLGKWHHGLEAVDIVAKREELFAIKQLNDIEGTSIYAGKKSEVVILDKVKGNLATNNSRQIYAQVSGLNIYEGSDGGLQLNIGGRGLDPNRSANFNIRQDGYDISADVLGYPENYYTPPSEAISEIRIIRGASSLQYGTQFGGLVDFRLRKVPSYKNIELITNQTIGSYGTFGSFNYIGFNKGKFSSSSFYNYKKGDGYRENSEYKAHNFFTSLNYKAGNKTDVGFEFTYYTYLAKQAGGLTDQQFATTPRLSTRDRNWFSIDWKLANFYIKHEFDNSSLLTLSLFGLDADRKSVGFRGSPIDLNENPITAIDEQDANGNYLMPRDLIDGKFKNYGAEVKYLSKYDIANKKSVFLIGGKFYKSDNLALQGAGSQGIDADFSFYNDQFPDYANQSDFRFPNLNLSLFSENIFYLSDNFSITPGIRLEHINTKAEGTYNKVNYDNAGNPISNLVFTENKKLKRNFVLLGVGVSYKKSNKLQIVANVSQNYRSVTFSDIRVVSPTFIVDPDIKDETGLTADIGVKGRIGKVLSYDLTLYSLLYQDRIGIILDSKANRVRKNIGEAIIAGSESLINLNIARWISPEERNYNLSVFVNSSFAYSEYLSSEEQNVVGKKVEFIPDLNLKTGISTGFKNFELSYQLSYLSEQYTDVQNSAAGAQGDKRSGIIGPIPSYMISDLSMSYRYANYSIKSGINNLCDSSYFTRRATGYPGPGIIPSDGRTFYLTLSYKL